MTVPAARALSGLAVDVPHARALVAEQRERDLATTGNAALWLAAGGEHAHFRHQPGGTAAVVHRRPRRQVGQQRSVDHSAPRHARPTVRFVAPAAGHVVDVASRGGTNGAAARRTADVVLAQWLPRVRDAHVRADPRHPHALWPGAVGDVELLRRHRSRSIARPGGGEERLKQPQHAAGSVEGVEAAVPAGGAL